MGILKAWWAEEFGGDIDAVISFDPVALSYLLNATGPLQLPTGETLTAENAVPLLLKDAYVAYPNGVDSDLFFAGAATTVFDSLTAGAAAPAPMVGAIVRAAERGG